MEKSQIRSNIRSLKRLLSDDDKEREATDVFTLLEQSPAFKLAERILMYNSLPDELPTRAFLRKWTAGGECADALPAKRFFLPRVNGVDLDILPYEATRLAMGAFHIEEPQGDDTVDMADIDMVVVPAVAYDRAGNRVGRGKGFYDRLLNGCRAVKVGVGYSFQLVDDIDAEPHDVGMDMVIAGNTTVIINRRRVDRAAGND